MKMKPLQYVRPLRRKEILEEYSLSLIGKFLATKPINIRVAKNLLRSMWKMGEDLKMVELDDGLLQFKFSMECQLNWVANQVRLDDAQGDKEKTKRLKVVADQTQPNVQTVEAAAQPQSQWSL